MRRMTLAAIVAASALAFSACADEGTNTEDPGLTSPAVDEPIVDEPVDGAASPALDGAVATPEAAPEDDQDPELVTPVAS